MLFRSVSQSRYPRLAYHKICNDHYRNEKWQPFQPWTCNIDYVNPSDNMNATSFVNITSFTWLMSSIIDLENANLPIDYFTSVLPRAQYGDESAVPVGVTDSMATLRLSDPADSSVGVMFPSHDTILPMILYARIILLLLLLMVLMFLRFLLPLLVCL